MAVHRDLEVLMRDIANAVGVPYEQLLVDWFATDYSRAREFMTASREMRPANSVGRRPHHIDPRR